MLSFIVSSASGLVVPRVARSTPRCGAPTAVTQGEVHGEGGAYVAGHWVPLELCKEKFNIAGGSNEKTPAGPCPRSITRHSSAKPDGSYDVAIIGSGCIGAAVARELSKTTASVVMLEAADDVCQGATKGNSGIVHAGFDDKPGSVRAALCWKGNQLFPQLDSELHFGYQLTGSLVVAFGEEQEAHLHELLARGAENGVKNLRIVGEEELRRMEPRLAPGATAALHSPDAGTLIPYEYTIALAENAADNGVEVRTRREVRGIAKDEAAGLFDIQMEHWEPKEFVEATGGGPLSALRKALSAAAPALGRYFGGEDEAGPWKDYPQLVKGEQAVDVEAMKVGGSGSRRAMGGVTVARETVRAKYVVNCAGGASDKVARLVGDESFQIKPRLGEYVLLKKSQGDACNHILFPCPGPLGKGILVQKTLWGNLILGPTARDVDKWPTPGVDPDSKQQVLSSILSACRSLVPDFETDDAFHSFSGARAKSSRGDWIIERCATEPDLIHAAGIDSPGIAGSPAIALEVVRLLGEAGLDAPADPAFNPSRAAVVVPKRGDEGLVYTPDDKESLNALGVSAAENVVCKCEKVTEAEVVDACRRSLPIDSTQAIRKRTRAGMGGCQGKPWNYGCECRVAQIIARETEGLPVAEVGRRPWSATSQFPRRWLSDGDKENLKAWSQPPPAEADETARKLEEALPLEVSPVEAAEAEAE